MYFSVYLAQVTSTNLEEAAIMSYTATGHQGELHLL